MVKSVLQALKLHNEIYDVNSLLIFLLRHRSNLNYQGPILILYDSDIEELLYLTEALPSVDVS